VAAVDGLFRNRATIIENDCEWYQDKVMLTQWEKQIGLSGGKGLSLLYETDLGVNICYDSEFPAAARALVEHEELLFIAVPAWTETLHGFHRVRWACQARAVENQVCMIHSSLVGNLRGEECHGSSAIIVPPNEPFPDNAILAETTMDQEGVAIAEVRHSDLYLCREMGDVRNWEERDDGDWTVNTVNG
jgi:predicted amidohydrolase